MNSRLKPCPEFPRDLKHKSYRFWRMELVHWVWQMREISVCESLWGTTFLTALKDGANGVHEAAILLDPRVLNHGGRPRFGFGPWDPGELSGVIWYVEAVLDSEFFKSTQTHEDGRKAREDYHKVV